MHIENFRLAEAQFQESPNHGGRFASGKADTLVLHYTAGGSAESAIRTLCDPARSVSAHVVVGKGGEITQLVPFDTVAWHAGRSTWEGRDGLNNYSIGIEMDNAGRLTRTQGGYRSWFGRRYDESDVIQAVHRNESEPTYWHAYAEEQIEAVEALCGALIRAYDIRTVVGHEEIAPKRKTDPGPAFPLDKLRDRLLNWDRRTDAAAEELPPGATKGFVTAGQLNIRASPGPQYPTVAPPLPRGTPLTILAEQAGWYEVEVSTRGWVSRDYVQT